MAAADATAIARLQGDEDLSSPSLDPADAECARTWRGKLHARLALGRPEEDRAHEPQRFEELVEAGVHAGRDVPGGMHDLRHLELVVGRARAVHAQVVRLP